MSETLTAARLLQVRGDLSRPKWWPMIRDARVVEVRVSEFVERGASYALDVEKSGGPRWAIKERDLGRIMVVCHPDDREAAHNMVDRVRLGV